MVRRQRYVWALVIIWEEQDAFLSISTSVYLVSVLALHLYDIRFVVPFWLRGSRYNPFFLLNSSCLIS